MQFDDQSCRLAEEKEKLLFDRKHPITSSTQDQRA
jgi:hypothetical protein